MKKFFSGEICQVNGLYLAITPNGEPTYTLKMMVKGRKFPPTPFSRCWYILVDPGVPTTSYYSLIIALRQQLMRVKKSAIQDFDNGSKS